MAFTLTTQTKRYVAIGVAIAALVGLVIWYAVTPPSINKSMAYLDETRLWTEFRMKNPINYQTVGIKAYEDGSYNVLLSEPSPDITIRDLKRFISEYHGKVLTHQCPMGIDGWLQDAILCFNGLKDEEKDVFTSKLFTLLYGTDYKAAYEDLDDIQEHTNYIKENVHYQISAEELQQWFIEDGEMLVSQDGLIETDLATVLNSDQTGIYYSKEPGFVIWVLDRRRNSPVDFHIPARMFALDADLILGAIVMRNKNVIAVIGRERELSLHELPPMRVETMCLLAATTKKELSQSYERNNLVAGKMSGGKDYAPILLSPELWHTEYGSILNVTDQMLKSWSQNGTVEYERFTYPKPYDWAFVDGASIDLDVSELTYNWNTSGAGYAIEADENNPYMIYALNRTGSLPVSYIPGETDSITENDKVFLAEETAYDFFSGLASPELIRVVQYASLYQIFVNCNFHLKQYDLPTYTINTKNVENSVDKLLISIAAFNDEQRQEIKDYYNRRYDKLIAQKDSLESLKTWAKPDNYDELLFYVYFELLFSDPEHTSTAVITKFDTLSNIVKEVTDMNNALFVSSVSHYIVNPRDIDYTRISRLYECINKEDAGYVLTNDDYAMLYAWVLADKVKDMQTYNALFNVFQTQNLRDIYIESNKESCSQWIKCPTVVQSWNMRDSARWAGGHNLNSRITPVKVDNSLAKGQCFVEKQADGSKIIRISQFDKGRITPEFLRNVERTGKSGAHNFRGSVQVVRTRGLVIPNKARNVRGFDPATQVTRVTRRVDGFDVNGKVIHNVDDFWKELANIPETKGRSFHNIVFENFSQDEVRMIMDGHTETILEKGSLSRTFMEELDFNHMEVSAADGDGKITVSIPMKNKSIVVGEGVEKKTVPLQSASVEIRVPKASQSGLIQALKEMFTNPDTGSWSPFRLKRMGKKNGLNPDEIQELYRYKISKNKLNRHPNDIPVLQTQVA